MALMEIVKYPDRRLKKVAKSVRAVTPEVRKLIEDMKETMLEEDGIGLAAPQVGVSKRVLTMQLFLPVVRDEEGKIIERPTKVVAFVNPKVEFIEGEDERSFQEGCLSFPGKLATVYRPERVHFKALDEDGNKVEGEMSGINARCLQHEIDHLDGILLVDRMEEDELIDAAPDDEEEESAEPEEDEEYDEAAVSIRAEEDD
jgi:peptide deformylase